MSLERLRHPFALGAATGALGMVAINGVPGIHLLPNIDLGHLFGAEGSEVAAANTQLDYLYAPSQVPLLIGHGKAYGYVDHRPHSSFGPVDLFDKLADNHHAEQNITGNIQVWIARKAIKAHAYKLSGSQAGSLGMNVYVDPHGLWTELAKDGTAFNKNKTPQSNSGESLVAGLWDAAVNANNSPLDVAAETTAKDAFDNTCGKAMSAFLIYAVKHWEKLELTGNAQTIRAINPQGAAHDLALAKGPINVNFLPLHKGQATTNDPWKLINYMPKSFVAPYPTPNIIAPILGDKTSAHDVSLTTKPDCLSAQLAVHQEESMLQQSLPQAAQKGSIHVHNT